MSNMNTDSSTIPLTEIREQGLSFYLTTFFIVGNLAGTGILVMPKAMSDTGWGGIPFITIICLATLYAGVCLSRCWIILEERFEKYRVKHRKPYPAIAEEAYGTYMKHFVTVIVEINFVGISIVYLLLPAELIAALLPSWGVSFCAWILILALLLCPLMWFGSPEDFKFIAVVVLITTVGSVIFLLVSMGKHAAEENLKPTHGAATFQSFFLSIGVILFSFGGAATYPTYQLDMKDRREFSKVLVVSFICVYALYFPVFVYGYYVYGDRVSINVIDSIPPGVYQTIVLVLMSIRTLVAFIMVINCSSQEFESICQVPQRFGWKRVLVRSVILLFILFIAVSLPRFGKILNLVGSSAIALTVTVFPCMFYYKLCSLSDPNWPDRKLTWYVKVVLILIIALGIVGGSIATYMASLDIVRESALCPPCYINSTTSAKELRESLLQLRNLIDTV